MSKEPSIFGHTLLKNVVHNSCTWLITPLELIFVSTAAANSNASLYMIC